MTETITKTFALIEVTTKKYVEDFVYPSAVFTENVKGAIILPTYSKANTLAKKINKFYGYKRVKVITINA